MTTPNTKKSRDRELFHTTQFHIRNDFERVRRHPGLLVYFLVISAVLMLLCTRSSFLYPYNNWDDANSYLTMGKSMMHGIRIYRDIFDQKGPWLYFLYGLCSLVSRTTFRGVFLMEIAWGVLDLCCFYRILRLYLKKNTTILLLPLLFAVSYSSWSFYWGGSAEELCLPFLLLPLYYMLRHFQAADLAQAEGSITGWEIAVTGLCCGISAGIKFTLLGFYFGWMLMLLLSWMAPQQRHRAVKTDNSDARFPSWSLGISTPLPRFLKACGIFLLMMFVSFVPWLVYFIATGTLDDFYRVYIYTNLFLYSSFGANDKGESLYERVYNLAKLLYWLIWDNLQYFLFIIIGFFWMLLRRGASLLSRIMPFVLFFFTFLVIYIGGAHLPYYSLPLTVFAATGFIAAGLLAETIAAAALSRRKAARNRNHDIARINAPDSGPAVFTVAGPAMYIAAAMSLAVALLLVYRFSANTFYLSFNKEDVFLTSFAEDIKRDGKESPTLLNYNCFDCGLYTVADIYPTCYWFQTQTLPIPDILDEQYRFMREGLTDYVVTRDYYDASVLAEKYELIDSFHQVIGPDGWEFDYYLFRLKE